ncbi:hypothetical protein WMY93_010569 [Mugilogobius chulae]|uniref:Uncharacterized protein n=1 Tax=Mugilogobius chulae TaxID=88201 RepID=A0AAW0P8X0_9GOBI
MAASLGSQCLTEAAAAASAVDPALASAHNNPQKPVETRGTTDNLSPTHRDPNQPPPKKIRAEERCVKPKKLLDDGSGKDKLKQPDLWNYSPVKASNSVPISAVGSHSSQAPTNAHKVLKQSDFFLHKTPKPNKKPTKDKHRSEKTARSRCHPKSTRPVTN